MNVKTTALAAIALGFAAPVMAQTATDNTVESLGNAAEDVGNAAGSAGDAIANGASNAVSAVDNAVDVNVTTSDANLTATDVNMTVDNGMTPMEGDDMNMVTTTTTTTQKESDGGGRWGLLGLLGLASFLFRPKPAIHLDERTSRV